MQMLLTNGREYSIQWPSTIISLNKIMQKYVLLSLFNSFSLNFVITRHLPITGVKEIISLQAKDMPRPKL